jgi:hypothetical protein
MYVAVIVAVSLCSILGGVGLLKEALAECRSQPHASE